MVQITDITQLTNEVQALAARVDAWLDEADAAIGQYAQLAADLAQVQQQLQTLTDTSGGVAAHQHQIADIQGLAAELAAKLADAGGVITTAHLADGAVTGAKIAPGAITAAALAPDALGASGGASGAGYQVLPSGVIIQWGVRQTVPLTGQAIQITWPVAFSTPPVVTCGVQWLYADTGYTIISAGPEGAAIRWQAYNYQAIPGMSLPEADIHWIAIGR